MSRKHELDISEILEININIKFTNKKYKLDSWGEVDNFIELKKNIFLFLEVETKQKHPSTNVVKVWPYLESKRNIKVFLIQTYFEDSPVLKGNRGRISEWMASKIKYSLPNRFDYHKLIISKEGISPDSIKEIQTKLSLIKK